MAATESRPCGNSIMRLLILLVGLLSVNVAAYSADSSKTFSSEVFSESVLQELKAKKLGEQWLMVLWSVDCPACFKELALLQKLKTIKPDLNVVVINTDDNDEIASERQKIIASYQLASLSNFHFADGEGDKSRFVIDSQWYGELPRSYFVEESGKFHGKSGLIDKKLIQHWLIPNELASNN